MDLNKDIKVTQNSASEYPNSDVYEYSTYMTRINLDKERILDITSGNGFIIKEPQGIKKDLKSPDSIYSDKFGRTLQDVDPYSDVFKCTCGFYRSREKNNLICPVCGDKVKFIGEDYKF